MRNASCPKGDLSELLSDHLDPVERERVMEHLEDCSSCQSELDLISADERWWTRAKDGLVGLETDSQCQIIAPEVTICSIETLLEVDERGGQLPDSYDAKLNWLDPPTHPETLGRIDEFEIEEKIGQGGMGIVFRGFDRSLNRPIAIKVMSPHLGFNEIAKQRFEREARAAAAVVHPNVVPIYRVSTTNEDRPYIAMALADGLSLQEHVSKYGPFDAKDVLRIGIQIASGLAEAHKQGLIHRDIKPANVLMEKDVGRILITDFGLARSIDDVMMTQSGCLAGTPGYMSPEQVTGQELDDRSDLFSLGALLYFIASGRVAFAADSAYAVIHQVTHHTPQSVSSMNSNQPEVLSRIIDRLLEKGSDDRIESAAKLECLLTQVLAHLHEPGQNQLPTIKPPTKQRKIVVRRMLWGFVLLVLLIVGGLLGKALFSALPEFNSKHGISGGGSTEHTYSESGDGYEPNHQ